MFLQQQQTSYPANVSDRVAILVDIVTLLIALVCVPSTCQGIGGPSPKSETLAAVVTSKGQAALEKATSQDRCLCQDYALRRGSCGAT